MTIKNMNDALKRLQDTHKFGDDAHISFIKNPMRFADSAVEVEFIQDGVFITMSCDIDDE